MEVCCLQASFCTSSVNIRPESPIPPVVLATLITSQRLRPFQLLPMTFPPVFLFASYLNTQGYKKDAAGLSAAWSALYLVLARRSAGVTSALKPSNWNGRGLTRVATVTLCLGQAVGGGLAYGFGAPTNGL